jgi:hypothetical protein
MLDQKRDLNSTMGTCYQGEIVETFENLVKVFGQPIKYEMGDSEKVDCEWEIKTPHGVGTIYNWKNGRNYMGEDGELIEDITEWNIGGHNPETCQFIKDKLKS